MNKTEFTEELKKIEKFSKKKTLTSEEKKELYELNKEINVAYEIIDAILEQLGFNIDTLVTMDKLIDESKELMNKHIFN